MQGKIGGRIKDNYESGSAARCLLYCFIHRLHGLHGLPLREEKPSALPKAINAKSLAALKPPSHFINF